MSTYTIGIDYGTESGRALLVRVEDGAEIATAVHPYGDGVLDRAAITVVGTVAMLWVGGHILLVGADELGWHGPYELVHHLEHGLGSVLGWVVNTACSAVVGLVVGAVVERVGARTTTIASFVLTAAATIPAKCAMSTMKYAPTRSAIARNRAKSIRRG